MIPFYTAVLNCTYKKVIATWKTQADDMDWNPPFTTHKHDVLKWNFLSSWNICQDNRLIIIYCKISSCQVCVLLKGCSDIGQNLTPVI